MNSDLRDAERELLREMGKRLERYGFSKRPKGQSFHREIEGGRVAVHLSFIEHESDVDVTADVAIRFDAVEDLVNRSNALLSKKEKAGTFTLGAELGNLESGEPFRVTVTGSADVAGAADAIEAKLETVGLPYIERYSRPEAAYSVLAKDERESWIHCPFHDARAKRACALLAVMCRHSEIKALGRQKLSFLESVRDPGAAMFSRFLAELNDS